MRRHPLSEDLDPVISHKEVAVARKLETPQRRIDAHDDLDGLDVMMIPKNRLVSGTTLRLR